MLFRTKITTVNQQITQITNFFTKNILSIQKKAVTLPSN